MSWIETTDRLPEEETPVLIVVNCEIRIGALFWEYPGIEESFFPYRYWDDPETNGQFWEWPDVTHWMPLPELPDGLEGNLPEPTEPE